MAQVIVKTPTAATRVEPIAKRCINLAPTANKIITVTIIITDAILKFGSSKIKPA